LICKRTKLVVLSCKYVATEEADGASISLRWLA
jgi:hypothetical protein